MRAATLYRALLHCYPAAFRHEYGSQMLLMFSDQLGEARRTGGPLQQAALWARAALDTFTIAPREHCNVIFQDLRYALRTMASSRSFTAVAILSLALGIGANTAIFSLWNGVLHASLPGVAHPQELVMLTNPDESGMWSGRVSGNRDWLTWGEFEELRDHTAAFSGLMASQSSLDTFRVRFSGAAWEEASGRLVSGGYFQLLGVTPQIGRVFTAADDHTASPYAVLSHSYWQRRFGGRFDILGQTLTIRNTALTIIGVAPPGFIGETSGQQPDFWLPIRMQPWVLPGKDRLHDVPPEKVMWLQVFGRLAPGVSMPQAESRANATFVAGLESFYGAALAGDRGSVYLDQHIRLQSGARGASHVRHGFSQSLTALLAAVGVLLLVACANLANLLLARNAIRKHEIALRVSLGASRGRLIRQLVTESLSLAAIGGIAALAVAYLLHGALVAMLASSDSRFRMTFTLDPIVLAFLILATFIAALLFGVLPAWQITRANTGSSLNEWGRSATASRSQTRSGRLLVSLQLALSLPLLVGAGLLVRTLHNLQRADLGYPTERLLLLRIDSREGGYDPARRPELFRELARQLAGVPGVRAVSYSSLGIFSGGEASAEVDIEGYTPPRNEDRESGTELVGPRYFSTLGVPISLGRDILETDSAAAPAVCVINEAFARHFFEGRNPIGLRIAPAREENQRSCQVVGVVGNARTHGLRDAVRPRYYVPVHQSDYSLSSPTFLIRTSAVPSSLLSAARQAVRRADPALPIMLATSLEDEMSPLTAQDRTTAQLAVVFGAVALSLAAIGLYGVLSYGIARRRNEIAVRIAVGARPGRVVAMILRETAAMVSAGMAAGAALAYAASHWITSQLYGVAPQDPLTLTLAIALLLAVAFSAAYLPARRASRLDPMTALRQE